MFKTRAVLYQKAYQHKTIQAVEKMYIIISYVDILTAIMNYKLLIKYRIGDAFLQVQDIHLIRINRYCNNSV